MTTKRCARCGRSKALEDFARDARKPDGRQYACKDCRNKRLRQRREREWDGAAARLRDRRRYVEHGDAVRQRRRQRYWDERGGVDVERLERIKELRAAGRTNSEIVEAVKDEYGVRMTHAQVAAWAKMNPPVSTASRNG